ncbi:MAG: RNA polymerase sigma factor RpoD/SigA [Holophaga sp.]|nr:RNA polymerase sigma factor RpoD/SigA [Holophaga sp.]
MSRAHPEDRSLANYFDLIRDLPLLTPEQERINGRLWQRDRDPEGLRKLVEGNLRFVVKEALKFQGKGLDLIDLVSEGNLGLIEAAKRFDPERENKFLTYAVWWVRQSIFRALAEYGNRIRLPQKLAGQVAMLNRVTHRVQNELGRMPTLQELADACHLPAQEVERLQVLQRTTIPLSTEQELGDSGLTLGDRMEQNSVPSPMEVMDQESFLDQFRMTLALLKEKERRIIGMHYGLDGGEPMTLECIGQSFQPQICKERVRQIEERAFTKVRDHSKRLMGSFLLAPT